MRRKSLSSRCAAAVSRHWQRLRLRWYTANKVPLAVVFAIGMVMSIFGGILYSLYVYENGRRELMCLALNIYFESRGESTAGQYAVAEVTMNRVASKHYPDSVCDVVYQKNWDWIRKRHVAAFSWTDLDSLPQPSGKQWQQALRIAETVYKGKQQPTLDGAMHYHAVYVKPSWSVEMTPVAKIDRHIFYK
jgi:N-acetylmuramoyl-L-alanine amidase